MIASRLVTTAELTELLAASGCAEAEIPGLISQLRTVENRAYLLAEKIRYERFSRRKAYKLLREEFPWLTAENLDNLIADGLFATR